MDDTQDVGLEGADEKTNSSVSTKSIESAPQQSQELLEIKKALELTRSELKGLQSRQDKETNEVQRFMGEVKKRMAKGMSLEEAEQSVVADEQAAKKDDLLLRIAQKVGVLDQPSATPAGNGQTPTIDRASTLSTYGLNENDPDVALALQGANTPLEVKAAALEVAYKRATKPSPDPSAATSPQGKPGGQNDDELIVRLTDLQKDPVRNAKAIREVEAKLGW